MEWVTTNASVWTIGAIAVYFIGKGVLAAIRATMLIFKEALLALSALREAIDKLRERLVLSEATDAERHTVLRLSDKDLQILIVAQTREIKHELRNLLTPIFAQMDLQVPPSIPPKKEENE